jgi:predicted permease
MAVSFVFLGRNLSPEEFRATLPGVYYSLLGAILFTFVFSLVAQRFSRLTPHKKWPVFITLLSASFAWILIPLV